MTWLLTAWLCAASGECRPVEAPYPTRSACLRAERVLKRQEGSLLRTVHCHHLRDEVVG